MDQQSATAAAAGRDLHGPDRIQYLIHFNPFTGVITNVMHGLLINAFSTG